jgi:catechol-2,3-dioxygenase
MHDERHRLNRRQFLKSASAATLAVATYGQGTPISKFLSRLVDGDAPRILRLRLATAASLAKMKHFYHEVLEFPVLAERPDEITIRAGLTQITFVAAKPDHGEPFYHFAFNVPENKILLAREWQKERTPLFQTPAHLRDSLFPDDVRHFANWNAHSIFFWDPAGNVLEYIARHDLKNSASGPFTSADILYASEIGFVSDDVPSTAMAFRQTFGLEQYRGGDDQFRAIGDEHGLLLVFKRGRDIGTGSGKTQPVSVFPTEVSIRGEKQAKFETPEYPYEISAG